MKILIQSPRIANTSSPFHLKKKNVLIANGRIAEIGDKNFQADKTIDAEGMYLTAGERRLSYGSTRAPATTPVGQTCREQPRSAKDASDDRGEACRGLRCDRIGRRH